MKRTILTFLLLSLAAESRSADYSAEARGTTTAGFLKLGAGARAAAMGDAFAAVADDATALYWNPAALTRVRSRDASFMHALYLDSSYYDHAGVALPGGGGVLGLGIQHFSAGVIKETDATGAQTGRFTPNDLAVAAGYAREFRGLSVGAAVKHIRSKIQGSAQATTFDAGLLSPPLLDGRLRVALTGSNLSGRMQFEQVREPLPTIFRAGGAFQLTGSTLISLDISCPRDNQSYAGAGLERRLRLSGGRRFFMRAGYNSRSAQDLDGLTGFSFGLGLAARSRLDYAVVPFGDLGVSHRLSFGIGF